MKLISKSAAIFVLITLCFSFSAEAIFSQIKNGDDISELLQGYSTKELNELHTILSVEEILERLPNNFLKIFPEGLFARVTPLHIACFYSNERAFFQLVEKGADIHAKTLNHWTCAHFVAIAHSPKILDYLLEHSKDEFSEPSSLAQILPEKDYNARNVQAFIEAAKTGKIDNVRATILENFHLMDAQGSALYWALAGQHTKVAHQLLSTDLRKMIGPKHLFAAGLGAFDIQSENEALVLFCLLNREYKIAADKKQASSLHEAELHFMVLNGKSVAEISAFMDAHTLKTISPYYIAAGFTKWRTGSFEHAQALYNFLKSRA